MQNYIFIDVQIENEPSFGSATFVFIVFALVFYFWVFCSFVFLFFLKLFSKISHPPTKEAKNIITSKNRAQLDIYSHTHTYTSINFFHTHTPTNPYSIHLFQTFCKPFTHTHIYSFILWLLDILPNIYVTHL